jgi:hypothetical protein
MAIPWVIATEGSHWDYKIENHISAWSFDFIKWHISISTRMATWWDTVSFSFIHAFCNVDLIDSKQYQTLNTLGSDGTFKMEEILVLRDFIKWKRIIDKQDLSDGYVVHRPTPWRLQRALVFQTQRNPSPNIGAGHSVSVSLKELLQEFARTVLEPLRKERISLIYYLDDICFFRVHPQPNGQSTSTARLSPLLSYCLRSSMRIASQFLRQS